MLADDAVEEEDVDFEAVDVLAVDDGGADWTVVHFGPPQPVSQVH